jgi:hypothetical protein
MSMELHVLVDDSRLPDARHWQGTIVALRFDLKLDPSLSVRDNRGFLPCTFKGRQSGFEFDTFPASDIFETYPEFQQRFSGYNLSANFRWGGDLVEMACALIASATLAKLCGGVWFDPQEGMSLNAQEALEQVKTYVAAVEL